MIQTINKLFISFTKRAEKVDHKSLVASFVDVGPLFTVLSTTDNQIIYGRRGTGKTHALVYLAESKRGVGDVPIYIDLRQVGSTGGLYSDPHVPFSERATRLLVDTLASIHDELMDAALNESTGIDLSQVSPVLDDMADAISEVSVRGTAEEEMSGSGLHKTTTTDEAGASLTPKTVSVTASTKGAQEQEHKARID